MLSLALDLNYYVTSAWSLQRILDVTEVWTTLTKLGTLEYFNLGTITLAARGGNHLGDYCNRLKNLDSKR